MKTIKPGKQRKMLYNAPLHKKRKWTAAHLEENLLLKYDKRSIPIVKGDTVRVMRGSFRGHEDKIAHVNIKKGYLEIEGITMSKADGNKIAKPVHPSNVMITKLNLTDKWRRNKLERGLTEEAKKEIEREAKEQLVEAEKEAEELRKQKELEEMAEKEAAEEEPEKPIDEEEKAPKKAEEKTKKVEEKKPAPKKKAPAKKTPAKKAPAKKKTTSTKKTPVKKTTGKGGKTK